MMTCDICGWDTRVSYSKRFRRAQSPGSSVDLIRRRRECLKCRARFYTRELREYEPEEATKTLEAAWQERDDAQRKLSELVLLVNELGEAAGTQGLPPRDPPRTRRRPASRHRRSQAKQATPLP